MCNQSKLLSSTFKFEIGRSVSKIIVPQYMDSSTEIFFFGEAVTWKHCSQTLRQSFLRFMTDQTLTKKKQTARLQEKAHRLFDRKKLQTCEAAIAPGIR